VVVLCFLTIVFAGYDLIAHGLAVPRLLAEPGRDLGPAQMGAIGSYALVGTSIGALGAGVLSRPRRDLRVAVPALAGALLIALVPRSWQAPSAASAPDHPRTSGPTKEETSA
jgi:hypothetical protein